MHIYVCPYCDPSPDSHLVRVKDSTMKCKHKKKMCEEKDYKCKEVMKCMVCKSTFVPNDEFLSQQKRKIKDG
jgi:hypothetical protein